MDDLAQRERPVPCHRMQRLRRVGCIAGRRRRSTNLGATHGRPGGEKSTTKGPAAPMPNYQSSGNYDQQPRLQVPPARMELPMPKMSVGSGRPSGSRRLGHRATAISSAERRDNGLAVPVRPLSTCPSVVTTGGRSLVAGTVGPRWGDRRLVSSDSQGVGDGDAGEDRAGRDGDNEWWQEQHRREEAEEGE